MTALTARADVPTEAPDRYAKQLLSHLGHRTSWTTDGATSTAPIAGGTGTIVVGDGVLTLIAAAPDADALARVQHVLGSHLERFAQRAELQVSWVGDTDLGGGLDPPRGVNRSLTSSWTVARHRWPTVEDAGTGRTEGGLPWTFASWRSTSSPGTPP